MLDDGPEIGAMLIVSEKLNANTEQRIPIPQNHFIAVDRNLDAQLSALQH